MVAVDRAAELTSASRAIGRSLLRSQSLALLGVVLVLATVASFLSDVFLTSDNLTNVLRQVAVLGIVSAGMTLLIVAGGIDLSVGAVASLSGVLAAKIIAADRNMALAVVVALAAGAGIGLLNGLLTGISGAHPLILTLGSLSIVEGIALVITSSQTIDLGERFLTLGTADIGAVPVMVAAAAGVLLAMALVLRFTTLGRNAYAIGGNETASYLAGIKLVRTKVALYGLSGLLAGFAGLVLLSRVGAASATVGIGLELQAVAAVVIGGASLVGGKGSIFGTCLGVLLLGLISNVLNLLNVNANYQGIVLGGLIVTAVVLNEVNARRGSTRYGV
jgi:ribose/xylose/arabinose/galactoside ABC-type transport system permease subunit